MVPLLVTADDFGCDARVDAGIARLVDLGRVSATACLVGAPRWPEAAALARTLRTRADVGLHFDLTEYGRLGPLPSLFAAAMLRALPEPALRARLRRQLDLFEQAVGAPPDYVDGHQHVHQFPQVARLLASMLRERYPGREPWVRVSMPAQRDLKSRLIAMSGARGLARRLDTAGLRHTGRLLGIYGFGARPPWIERLAHWLAQARAGDALMVHPAAAVVPGDPLGAARVREYEALASPQAAALLAEHGVAPARGTSLPRAAGSRR